MGEIKATKNVFLWCMSVIYLFAFSSIYHQIPGLFGDNGILPAKMIIPVDGNISTIHQKSLETPTLLWLAPWFGLGVDVMMELLALLGIIVSFCAMVWSRMRECANFGLLWMLYFSLYQVGQVFLWFQWDILLLEAGIVTIIVAPLGIFNSLNRSPSTPSHKPHDNITLWLVRWLLFRLMFASGVVKLTSQCPTWWNLTALTVHFESQCLPTSLSWFFHHLPLWFLSLSVAVTFIIEIGTPFLFFVPIRSVKMFSFYAQMLLQVLILLTGNYNFFNVLTIALCFSLVDDEFLLGVVHRTTSDLAGGGGGSFNFTKSLISAISELVIYGGLIYFSVVLFSIQIQPDWTVSSKVAFTPEKFNIFVEKAVPVSICIGVVSLLGNILLTIYRSVTWPGNLFSKIWSTFVSFIICFAVLWIFIISLVPHSAISNKSSNSLWPIINQWYRKVDNLHIVNSYGLFRRMTGVGGRPEIIIEGSNNLDTGWKEYNFLYKPGDMSRKPSFIIPHQPRLDWQMWFAALGTYKENPWFVSLIYRLLSGQPEVLNLLDVKTNPFSQQPPKYVRAILYTYSYTPFDLKRRQRANDWWTRKKEGEYFPIVSREHKPLMDYLQRAGIPVKKRPHKTPNTFLKKVLHQMRVWTNSVHATMFIWSIFSAGFTINLMQFLVWI